ncbi:MAG: low molecular weight protein-tyrosine-phosphatase [Bacteroidota bacterium]
MKILTVCLGNICRSPMAQGILRNKIKEKGLNITVDSAGTSDFNVDALPDPRARKVLNENNMDISDLRGRQFTPDDFDTFDLILAMDEDNYENIIAQARNNSDNQKVEMLMNYLYTGENISVPDPYFGDINSFHTVYELIDKATDQLLMSLTSS